MQIFRDRWEMRHIGTLIFFLEALMLVPYIIIGVMGGGETLEGVSGGFVPYQVGGAIVALVVMSVRQRQPERERVEAAGPPTPVPARLD